MARKQRAAPGGTWEVDLVTGPSTAMIEPRVLGILLVVEARTGNARLADIVADARGLTAALQRAATAPVAPCRPGAPARILCRAEHRDRIARAASILGARIEVVTTLPSCDALAASMLQAISAAPTLPVEPAAWAPVMAALWRTRPWDVLSDSVAIRFTGGPDGVRGWLAIVLGLAGEQHGLSFFRSDADYERFLDWMDAGGRGAGDWRCSCVHFDPVDELPAGIVQQASAAGLVHDGYVLQLFGTTGVELRDLDPRAQQLCLVMTQAVLAAWAEHGPRLRLGASGVAQTVQGPVPYSTADWGWSAPPDEPLLWPCVHQVHLGRASAGGPMQNTFVFKAAAADARRLVERLDGIDALSLEGEGERTAYVAWRGGQRVGVIAHAPWPYGWEDEPSVLFVVSGGGAQRTRLDSRHFELIVELALRGADAPTPAAPSGYTAPDPVNSRSWDGPVETWPKASSVLLEFARPLGVEEAPADVLPQLISTAALAWCCVVLADDRHDPSALEQARGALADEPAQRELFESLVARKRKVFARDRRIMVVEECRLVRGEIQLRVSSSLA